MPQSFINVWIHMVWSTKYKGRVLSKSWRRELFEYMKTKSKENKYRLDFINGVEDHVHLLIKMRSTETLADISKNLKGSSSRWINERHLTEGLFSWQNGYSAISVSPDRVNVVRNYIRNQEIHHRDMTLDEEIEKYFSSQDDDID